MERQKQADRILALLQAHAGEWVELPEILSLQIASFTRRIFELRQDGHLIENKTCSMGGQCHSAYRLRGRLNDELCSGVDGCALAEVSSQAARVSF